ncbi:unnamed protein product [Pseudo-nitzschia multistriata]|uniref:Uncharacterized protein n=1 Tax=Pseudo-nitzschia multistriata TaxID=183589 RepID=A0A448Z9C4_9STRA|nr:unnamed protein product [Pseudo-nitzschia multistriata]
MPGSMTPISSLTKLKTLSASNNLLGRPVTNKNSKAPAAPSTAKNTDILPTPLPKGLRTILLSNNSLTTIPRSIVNNSNPLKLLEKLDLSFNNLATVPESIANLVALNDLNLDSNVIVSLPPAIGKLKRLKALSLRNNHISSATTPQPLPEELWTNTLLIDMNLHGNPMTSTQLNSMDGYDAFLSRRREVKNKDILGGALTDLDGCGLK